MEYFFLKHSKLVCLVIYYLYDYINVPHEVCQCARILVTM